MIDRSKPIIPAMSAAGLELGQSLSSILDGIRNLVTWSPDGPDLADLIGIHDGWIIYRNTNEDHTNKCGPILFINDPELVLKFNSNDELYSITVSKGYEGPLFDFIKIGSPVRDIKYFTDLDYDDGDEAYYPTHKSMLGLSFNIEPGSATSESDFISAISVNDWSMIR